MPIKTPGSISNLRREAAHRLGRQPSGNPEIQAPRHLQQAFQELQIQQIELELQNEQLKRSESRMAEGLERYTDLFDFAPVGYFTLIANSTIRQVNLTGASLVGMDRADLVNRRFVLLLPAGLRAGFNDFLKQVFAGESNCRGEFELSSPTQATRTISVEARCVHPWVECRAVVVDVTKRNQVDQLLRRNEALFSDLIQQAPVGVYVVDSELRLQKANPMALAALGGIHPLIGRDWPEIVHLLWPKRTADQIVGHFRHTLDTGDPYIMPEFVERREDTGAKEIYDWQIQRITLPNGDHGVVCFFNNITERKRAEGARQKLEILAVSNQKLKREIVRRQGLQKALIQSERHARELLGKSQQLQKKVRRMSHQIVQAQEKLRDEISHELHDKVSQLLLGINVRLGVFVREVETHPKNLRRAILPLRRLVAKSVRTVHQYSVELRPLMLDELGLIPALRSYIDSIPQRKGREIRFSAVPGVEALSNAKRTVIFRVAQEALSNVIQHARARVVTVDIREVPGGVCLEIADDGCGFLLAGLDSAKWADRLGVVGMRERVEMVGGRFSVVSGPGNGTTVCAEVPRGKFKKLP